MSLHLCKPTTNIFSDTGLQGILDFLSTTIRPEAAKASPKDFYDTTILDRLEK